MSSPQHRVPMTAIEGFRVLSEEVLPKILKRIIALEQGGVSQPDTERIELQVITHAMQEVKKSIDEQLADARAQLLAMSDDHAKRLDELEKFVEGLRDERAAKAKRLTGKRKKKEEPKEPEQYSMLEPAQDEVPQVILEDAPMPLDAALKDTEVTDPEYIARQIKAIAGVGLPHDDIAAKFGMTVEQVQEIVADHTA